MILVATLPISRVSITKLVRLNHELEILHKHTKLRGCLVMSHIRQENRHKFAHGRIAATGIFHGRNHTRIRNASWVTKEVKYLSQGTVCEVISIPVCLTLFTEEDHD